MVIKMKKRLACLAVIISAALSLCSCAVFGCVSEVNPPDIVCTVNSEAITTDASMTDTFLPAGSDTCVHTETDSVTEAMAEADEVRFFVSDIVENGRTLELYGVRMNPALRKLEAALNAYGGKISFVAYDIAGDMALSYNSAQEYCSHCTIKAGYMLYCCKAIESGEVSADELLYYHKRHYDSGAGWVKKSPFGASYTVEKLIQLSLSVSDNAAYRMLAERFGKSGYNDFVTGIGAESLVLEDCTIWANRAKAADLIAVWREIYDYFAAGSDMALYMKEACTGTPYSYITEGACGLEYSHKSGEYYGEYRGFHDAAIVWNERPYLICAMSDSEGDEYTKRLYSMIICTVNELFSV